MEKKDSCHNKEWETMGGRDYWIHLGQEKLQGDVFKITGALKESVEQLFSIARILKTLGQQATLEYLTEFKREKGT